MTAFKANPGVFTWRAPNGRGGSFQPQGRLVFVGDRDALDLRNNPRGWSRKKRGEEGYQPTLSGRLIVGFNVGGVPTWEMDDLIKVVRDIRERVHKKEGATFIAQKGVYRHKESGQVVEEDGAQVIIIDLWSTPEEVFEEEMVALGEKVAQELQQEEVIVETQKDGVTDATIGVTP